MLFRATHHIQSMAELGTKIRLGFVGSAVSISIPIPISIQVQSTPSTISRSKTYGYVARPVFPIYSSNAKRLLSSSVSSSSSSSSSSSTTTTENSGTFIDQQDKEILSVESNQTVAGRNPIPTPISTPSQIRIVSRTAGLGGASSSSSTKVLLKASQIRHRHKRSVLFMAARGGGNTGNTGNSKSAASGGSTNKNKQAVSNGRAISKANIEEKEKEKETEKEKKVDKEKEAATMMRTMAPQESTTSESGSSTPSDPIKMDSVPPNAKPFVSSISEEMDEEEMAQNMPVPSSLSTAEMLLPGYRGEIFCNRNLNLGKIAAIGFDMDYTIATYKAETFELLAYEGARRRLVEMGYPSELLEMNSYDPNYFCRGLVVDKKRGNILKMDRHKYVKVAYHGFKPLTKAERDVLYDPAVTTWSTFREPDYAVLDTLFSLPDAYLYCELIGLKEKYPARIPQDFLQIYKDIRQCVDISHRDGFIKLQVAADPGKYIVYDPDIIKSLKNIKKSGRKVFLVTNSLYDYTDVVMKYLTTGGDVSVKEDWRDLFDIIITGACKPGFLTDKNLSLYRVDEATGCLTNTEGPLFESVSEYLEHGKRKIFQGGNWLHLHKLLGVSSGTQLLYVGDHMYSDILRSKRELGWRTMLVIPELEHEVNVLVRERKQEDEINQLRLLRDDLVEWVDSLERELLHYVDVDGAFDEERKEEIEDQLSQAKNDLQDCKLALRHETGDYHSKFHPIWGQLFKTGYQNSRFAEQVENYACLYTSKVANLVHISPEHNFRCMSDVMPHDRMYRAGHVVPRPPRRVIE